MDAEGVRGGWKMCEEEPASVSSFGGRMWSSAKELGMVG